MMVCVRAIQQHSYLKKSWVLTARIQPEMYKKQKESLHSHFIFSRAKMQRNRKKQGDDGSAEPLLSGIGSGGSGSGKPSELNIPGSSGWAMLMLPFRIAVAGTMFCIIYPMLLSAGILRALYVEHNLMSAAQTMSYIYYIYIVPAESSTFHADTLQC